MPMVSTPSRIQRRRTAGWRTPHEVVYVGRGSRWGNPFKASAPTADERSLAALLFANLLATRTGHPNPEHVIAYPSDAEIRKSLAGRDLMCWCPIDQPCHADVLLRIANSQEDSPR